MHSILEVGSEQLRLFYYTAQERQIQMKYDALLVAHRVNSNTYFLCAISLLIGFPFSENFCSYSVIIFPSFISS